MTRQSYEFVTEEATSVEQIRSLKNKVYFTYFNPNGAYAIKKAADQRISDAVDAGRCKSGAIIAYGTFNDFHEKTMQQLTHKKRVGSFEVFYMINGLIETAAKADKFLGEI